MKHYRLSIYLLAMISLAGCRGLEHYLKPAFGQKHLDTAELMVVDTIRITVPDGAPCYFEQTDILDDRFLYGFSPYEQPLAMSVIDLREGTFSRIVLLDGEMLGGGTMIRNFEAISPDSLLFAAWPGKDIALTDGRGKILATWGETELKVPDETDAYLGEFGYEWSANSYLENMTYDRATGLLYIQISPHPSSFTAEYIRAGKHGVYDLSAKSWEAVYGPFEGTLKHVGDGFYAGSMEDSYQLVAPDNIYITYPVDHSVYIYDRKTLELERSLDISPSMAAPTPAPLYGAAAEDDLTVTEFRRSSPFYGPLYFHKDAGKFSRFYDPAPEPGTQRRRVLVAYDDNFNIVAEEEFDARDIAHIQPTSTGFVIQPYDSSARGTATFLVVSITDK